MEFAGRVFGVYIKSFLTGRSTMVVLNGQSSNIHTLNADVPLGSILGPTLFLTFINDLPDYVLLSFIFADNMTVFNHTRKNLSHVDLATNLSSDLSQITSWGERWLVNFNASKTKLLSVNHHRSVQAYPPPPSVFTKGEMLN